MGRRRIAAAGAGHVAVPTRRPGPERRWTSLRTRMEPDPWGWPRAPMSRGGCSTRQVRRPRRTRSGSERFWRTSSNGPSGSTPTSGYVVTRSGRGSWATAHIKQKGLAAGVWRVTELDEGRGFAW